MIKRLIILAAVAGVISLEFVSGIGPARATTRAVIMEQVIQPCVRNAANMLDVPEHELEAAEIIVFELKREFYEEIIDAVEESLRQNTDDDAEWSYSAGRAACMLYQNRWHPSDR